MKEINRPNPKDRRRGDTLDFYDDSFPKKATASLVKKADRREENEFISGYDSGDDPDGYTDSYASGDFDGFDSEVTDEGGFDSADDDYAIRKETASSSFRQTARRRSEVDEFDGNYGTNAKSSVEDHISIYKKSGSPKSGREFSDIDDYDDPYENEARRTKASERNSRINERILGTSAPGRDDRKTNRPRGDERRQSQASRQDDGYAGAGGSSRREDSSRRTSHSARQDDVYARAGASARRDDSLRRAGAPSRQEDQYRRLASSRQENSPGRAADDSRNRGYSSASKSRASAPKSFDDIANADSFMPVKTVVAGVLTILLLGVFTVLIVKINSTNFKYEEAEAEIKKLAGRESEYQQAIIDKDNLEDEIDRLTKELNELKSSVPEGPDRNTGAGSLPGGGIGPALPPENEGGEEEPPDEDGSTSSVTEYNVVDGDTLSKISTKFYGNPNEYLKIKEANNLTSDILTVGDKLIIP